MYFCFMILLVNIGLFQQGYDNFENIYFPKPLIRSTYLSINNKCLVVKIFYITRYEHSYYGNIDQ